MANERLCIANISSIGKEGQNKLSRSTFAIAGLGGIGGIAFELLLRAGAGGLRIADFDFLEESNANRQLLWSRENDGMKKEGAALLLAKAVNPKCKIAAFGKITGKNAAGFARGCAAVIDATDKPVSRFHAWQGCKSARVPYVFASALGGIGMLTVFSGKDFSGAFPFGRDGAKDSLSCDHALGPVVNSIGCLAAQQAMNIALSKPFLKYPKILSLDAFSGELAAMHRF